VVCVYYMCSSLIHRVSESVVGCRWQALFTTFNFITLLWSEESLEQFLISAEIVNVPQILMNFVDVD